MKYSVSSCNGEGRNCVLMLETDNIDSIARAILSSPHMKDHRFYVGINDSTCSFQMIDGEWTSDEDDMILWYQSHMQYLGAVLCEPDIYLDPESE